MKKRLVAACLPLLCLAILLSACAGGAFSSRAVETSAPLAEPNYGDAAVAAFDQNLALGTNEDFIFKGFINKVTEDNVTWTANGNKTGQWLTVCEIKVEDVLYGSAPAGKSVINVVFGQSSRMLDKNEFRLTQGQECYFITHLFNQADKSKANDPLRVYELGDAMGGTFFDLFPVANGVVSYQGWSFMGEQPADTGNPAAQLGTPSTIDEKAFLEKFKALIQTAKAAHG